MTAKTPFFINNAEKMRLINFRVYEQTLAEIFYQLENKGFQPILIKGWAAAQYYPKPWHRNPGDIDLVFRSKYVEDASELLSDKGFLHAVDIHNGLRHLDTVDLEDLYRNCLWMDCAGTPVRVLRAEDHLRILCVHWMNDGGANKDKLWDVFFAVERNRESFDWERCLKIVDSVRRDWILCAIFLTSDYLGLEIDHLPFAADSELIPQWIRQAVEKEWRSEIKLNSLHLFTNKKELLFKQILKRIPPNPLQATVELEKTIKGEYRLQYQLMNVFVRLVPSLQRIFENKK